jgi:hypothetical protein
MGYIKSIFLIFVMSNQPVIRLEDNELETFKKRTHTLQ